MAEHPIQGLMNVTMDKIRQMADSNTIIGKPIQTEDGTTILPVSKVSFGFASAGTDFDGKNAANKDLFGGGAGAGVNIQPVAFLIVKDGCVRTIQLSDGTNTVDRALTMLPELVEEGRKPGRMPGTRNGLLEWVRLKLAPAADGKALERIGFAVARAIGRHGIKPQPYMAPALEAQRPRVIDLATAAMRKAVEEINGAR